MADLYREITHVHARDAAPDLSLGRGLEVPLGQGVVDFQSILATLDQVNYRGAYTVERGDSPDVIADMGNAVEYLRHLAL